MNREEQRAKMKAEVIKRMAQPDPVERLTALVMEWRDLALRATRERNEARSHTVAGMHKIAEEVIP